VPDAPLTCDGCGRALPATARWCGGCGAPRPLAAPRVEHRAQPPRPQARRWVGAVAAPSVAVGILLGLLLATTASPDRPADPVGTPVDLERPGTAPSGILEDPPPAACLLPVDDGCGQVLVDDVSTVTAISPLGPEAVLVARSGGEVRRVDLPSGRERWSVLVFPGADVVGLHVDDGPILVLRPGAIARLDPSSGRVRWERRLGDPTAARLPRTLAVDGGVLVLAADGTLTSLDAGSGEVRWQGSTGSGTVVPTREGLVFARSDGSELWHPDEGLVWERDAALTPRPGPRGVRADGPLPLLSDQGFLVVATGEHLEPPLGGPTLRRVAGPVTLHLRWTDRRSSLDVTAYGREGGVAWTQSGLTVPCCHASIVPADGDRVAITSPDTGGVLLSLSTGARLAAVTPPPGDVDASLVGVAGDLALWRTSDGIFGASLDGAEPRVALAQGAGILALAPLLVADDRQVVVLDDVLTRDEERPYPGHRAGRGSGRS
jgi:hypothetical protein